MVIVFSSYHFSMFIVPGRNVVLTSGTRGKPEVETGGHSCWELVMRLMKVVMLVATLGANSCMAGCGYEAGCTV